MTLFCTPDVALEHCIILQFDASSCNLTGVLHCSNAASMMAAALQRALLCANSPRQGPCVTGARLPCFRFRLESKLGRRPFRLLANPQSTDDIEIPLWIPPAEIVQQPTSPADHRQQASSSCEIPTVFSHVIRQVVDSGGQDCDLNFRRSRIVIAQLVFLNQLLFTFFRDRHVLPWVLWGKPHAGGFCIDAPNLLRLGLTAIPTCALALAGHSTSVSSYSSASVRK